MLITTTLEIPFHFPYSSATPCLCHPWFCWA